MELMTDPTVIGESAIWTDDEDLECCSVVPEAPNVATFGFISPRGASFRYLPGQFLTLELPVPGKTVWRTYTISSSPSRPLTLSVTVKAQKDSIGTRWMLDHLRPGMRIRARGPAGIFTLPPTPKGKYLFVTAGSGITPALSMMTYLYDGGTGVDVALVNCARRPSEIICKKPLEEMATRVPSIKLHFIVEEDDPYSVWYGYRGQLNQIMLGLIAGDYMDREVYCCGPEPFMQTVRDVLNALSFDMDHYYQESFQVPVRTEEDAPEVDDVVPDEEVNALVEFASSGITTRCTEADTILTAARVAGLVIPSGCTMGICGTCKIRKTEGQVHMVHNGGITEEDIAEGYILACCSNPIGRVKVDA